MANWNIPKLMKSAGNTRTGPTRASKNKKLGKPAVWRKKYANYSNSETRKLERLIPFVGTSTLLLQFENRGLTEKRAIHRIHIQFQNLNIQKVEEDDYPPENHFSAKYKGNKFFIEKPMLEQNMKSRCSCSDFYFRFSYPNFSEGALFGSKPRPYKRKTTTRPIV